MDPNAGKLYFLSCAESRYAIIELVMLAVVWTVINVKYSGRPAVL